MHESEKTYDETDFNKIIDGSIDWVLITVDEINFHPNPTIDLQIMCQNQESVERLIIAYIDGNEELRNKVEAYLIMRNITKIENDNTENEN